ncbi:DUF3231 family protein [Halalkalibacter sp. AB-rgal2]|uniref:DUF3231 family protein n=1 Tax=Halalkalibacter sp. AB-rgal2 TaxID=3242695 RepID=UPI00359E8F21
MAAKYATTHKNTKLNSVEMSSLWRGYTIETVAHYMFEYFLVHVEDRDIKKLIQTCHKMTKEQVELYESLFKKEHFPDPRAILLEDVNLQAPRLFTDAYYINYIKTMTKFMILEYTNSFTEVTRDDLEKVFSNFISNLKKLELQATDLMLSKGLYTHPPLVPVPETIDFVKDQSFIGNMIHSSRPLNVTEVANLFTVAEANALGKATLMAFSQVAEDTKVKQYLLRGKEIAHKYIHIFNDILLEEDISTVKTYDNEITDCQVSPFSDRFMLIQTNLLITKGIGNYGAALAADQRKDLATHFARIMMEVATYGGDGMKLLIGKGWMEQPPLAVNRNKLAAKK